MAQTAISQAPFDLATAMSNLTDQAFMMIPIEFVQPEKGFNHRRFFDDGALNELADDISRNKITQPLVVRPSEEKNGFTLIAGERRYRAAKIAGLKTLPVMVRLVSDAKAYAISSSENLMRENISPAEESVIAHRSIGLCDGDRSEAAKLLGWTPSKLDARMLLLHCDKLVLRALAERKILLGHAELLAGLTSTMQAQSLTGIIDSNISVTDLKASIGRYAYQLDASVFDVSACAGCEHNSCQSADLFSESIGSGNCLNRECYDAKTLSFLDDTKKGLVDEHNVVYFDTEKPGDQRIYLAREGATGVGREQFAACQSCAFNGALMVTEKGKEGQVEPGVCFKPACNTKKVKSFQASIKPKSAGQVVETTTNPPTSVSKPKAKKPSTPAVPQKLLKYVESLHFRTALAETPKNPQLVSVVALLSLIKEVSDIPDLLKKQLKAAGLAENSQYTFADRGALMGKLLKLSAPTIASLTSGFAAALVGASHSTSWGEYMKLSRVAIKTVGNPLDNYFVMDAEFLGLLTIAGINEVLKDAGFKTWYTKANNEKALAKLIKVSKVDLIKNILAADFDWSGFVPQQVQLPQA